MKKAKTASAVPFRKIKNINHIITKQGAKELGILLEIPFEKRQSIPLWAYREMNDGNLHHVVKLTQSIRGMIHGVTLTAYIWSSTGVKITLKDLK
jgi:hypothetical protein